MLWHTCQNRIPTLVELNRRNINVGPLNCRVCGVGEETTDHLFIGCHLAQFVWEFVAGWCKISPVYAYDIKDLVNLYRHLRSSFKWKKLIYMVMQTSIWCIWRCRNDLIFNHKEAHVTRLVEEIRVLAFL
ncbi:putative reverse transcriptase zinc-binding domain-containing protein [Helianthus anomalus]